jgi:hypothetical protein
MKAYNNFVFSKKMPEITLPAYLQRIAWETTQFTNEQLEIMLAASCLRYLGGLTDILFVLGLSEKIRERQKDNKSLPLHQATATLHDLAEELTNKTIASTDTETLRKNIDNAQKVITQKSVLELF